VKRDREKRGNHAKNNTGKGPIVACASAIHMTPTLPRHCAGLLNTTGRMNRQTTGTWEDEEKGITFFSALSEVNSFLTEFDTTWRNAGFEGSKTLSRFENA